MFFISYNIKFMKVLLLIVLIVGCFFSVGAQDGSEKKVKLYKTWIKLNNSPQIVKGILYQVSDSTIIVAGLHNYSDLHQYSFSHVDLLKVRRAKSVGRGAVTGSIIGFGSGIIMGSAIIVSEDALVAGLISATLGLSGGFVGAGIGALVGTIKDRFPIKNSFGNLEKYRGNLQDYSFKREEKAATHTFVHRGYLEFSMGLSFARGEFASHVPINYYQGMDMTGLSSKTTIGYWFTKGVGISFVARNSQYSIAGDSQRSWSLDAFTLGPVISMPIAKNLRFDLTPAVGFASAYLIIDNKEVYTGEGFGMNISGALRYDISKRLSTSVSVGYLSSKQEFIEGGSGQAQDTDIELGLAYKFGKRSL